MLKKLCISLCGNRENAVHNAGLPKMHFQCYSSVGPGMYLDYYMLYGYFPDTVRSGALTVASEKVVSSQSVCIGEELLVLISQ